MEAKLSALDYDFAHVAIVVVDWDAERQNTSSTDRGACPSSAAAAAAAADTKSTSDGAPRIHVSPAPSPPPSSPTSPAPPPSSPTSPTFAKHPADHFQPATSTTGFADVADALWSRMTGVMRERLREACVEVLRRTEDEEDGRGGDGEKGGLAFGEERWGEWDEDARLLD
ncbi:hypothetical protein LTR53_013508 [Teratosphaeriaceae sp. CCFEE 6253]|nr:hypothetical protein LTR53_013508 [Teratosphaeriaceae sp. CCFEE 6253]